MPEPQDPWICGNGHTYRHPQRQKSDSGVVSAFDATGKLRFLPLLEEGTTKRLQTVPSSTPSVR